MAKQDRIIVVTDGAGANGASTAIPNSGIERAGSAAGNTARGLLTNQPNDSVLKKVVIWGAAGFGLYFGSKFLLGTIGKDLAAREQKAKFDDVTKQAQSGTVGNSVLAVQMVTAINPQWSAANARIEPSHNAVNEAELFRLLAGPMERNWLGIPKLKKGANGKPLFKPVINSRQSFQDVSNKYATLTFGRSLASDLYEYMDLQYGPKNDYNALKPYLDYVQCINRVVKLDAKTKKVISIKLVPQNCPPLPD